jgi:hypothetical protein
MANFTRANPASWTTNDPLTSAQMNHIDEALPKLINASEGSTHAPSGVVTINGEGIVSKLGGRTFELSDAQKAADGDYRYAKIFPTVSETDGGNPVFTLQAGDLVSSWSCNISSSTRGMNLVWTPPADAIEVVSVGVGVDITVEGAGLPELMPRIRAGLRVNSSTVQFAAGMSAASTAEYLAQSGTVLTATASAPPATIPANTSPSGVAVLLIRLFGESGTGFVTNRQRFTHVVVGYRTIGFRC